MPGPSGPPCAPTSGAQGDDVCVDTLVGHAAVVRRSSVVGWSKMEELGRGASGRAACTSTPTTCNEPQRQRPHCSDARRRSGGHTLCSATSTCLYVSLNLPFFGQSIILLSPCDGHVVRGCDHGRHSTRPHVFLRTQILGGYCISPIPITQVYSGCPLNPVLFQPERMLAMSCINSLTCT